jgi:predicted O-linked N-acetylglucosamine transferase (SPINDLY family)
VSEGWRALEADDFAAAEAHARRALAQDAADAEALRLLGASLLYQARYAEALGPLEAAHRAAPHKGSGHRLGYCHLALGDFAGAAQVLQREVQAFPDLVNAHLALGVALVQLQRQEEALAAFLEAARLDPGSAEAHTNAGNVLAALGRHDEALAQLRQAAQAPPGLADPHFNLGVALQRLKRHEEAIDSFQAALGIAPRMPYALGHRLWNELSLCRWDAIGPGSAELRRQVRDEGLAVAPFTFLALSDDPQEQRLCAELHLRKALPALAAPLWRGERYRHDRIRVAYLSADFCEHATAYLAAGLFERHDRSRFETVALSYGADDRSPMRARLARAFDKFVDVRALSDAHVARLLRDMEIDIAVDMKGHTTEARIGILAHRPAPVQVAYLGYPGTSGAGFIDYVLADRFVLPEIEQQHWTEKVVYLPDCYQVNDAGRAIAEQTPTRAEAGLPERAFVFCCFNNSYKILPRMFDVWMRLLRELHGSVLWLLEDNAGARVNLEREARARGVDPARLVFARRLPHAGHLARHRLADLFLDTLPYNAHTGASDALWAGLPVLTCAGSTFAGRVAGSLLRAVGLPELATRSLAGYEALALQLASDRGRLRQLRERLAANRDAAPLFDTERFRQNLESAYRAMWQASPGS